MKQRISREIREWIVLLRSVPSVFFALFAASVIIMNLLANKSMNMPVEWLALDCGTIISWVSFLCMDVMTKHFGPKAATKLTITAVLINLFACLVFFAGSRIPGMWGEAYVDGSETMLVNALDNTFGGSWFVLMGSTIAMIVASIVNNSLNFAIGKAFKKNPDGFAAYSLRSYVSTAVGQFCDNLVFALIVSLNFFGWTLTQCITCALTGMLVELICEVIFSPLGYRISRGWKKDNVGTMYFQYIEKEAKAA